jgi:MarR family transcriptional regulator, multiple antibiotic resistance protein MarR
MPAQFMPRQQCIVYAVATKAQDAFAENMTFFADLVRCETRLYNQFNDELRTAHGIVTSQYEFLGYIRDQENPRTTDIAAAFAIGVGAVSKAVDRLEIRGLVGRLPNPANRRSNILELTDAGRKLIDAADATFQTRLAEILANVGTSAQLAASAALLSRLRIALERDGLGTPVG